MFLQRKLLCKRIKQKNMDKEQNTNCEQEQPQNAEVNETAQDNSQTEPEVELSETEKLQKELDETRAALEKEKKEYLFLMADFDNFRKRVLKEKAELIKNAGEKTLSGILAIVDDFERGLEATKDVAADDAVRQGMELIYQKMVKYLADNGVKAMVTEVASDFDADLHEAIAIVPAPSEELKGKIIDTTQKGYTINEKVLRHAKVVVGQ
jgi:molecular chaperone GrpE